MATITLEQLRKLAPAEIVALAERGIITLMSDKDITDLSKQDMPEYQQFESLNGQEISVNQASKKYGVPSPTLSRWAKRGIIKVLRRGSNKRKYLNEQDVAYCSAIRKQNPGQGKWVFDDSGIPYTPTTR